jgi:hypothetical protein
MERQITLVTTAATTGLWAMSGALLVWVFLQDPQRQITEDEDVRARNHRLLDRFELHRRPVVRVGIL